MLGCRANPFQAKHKQMAEYKYVRVYDPTKVDWDNAFYQTAPGGNYTRVTSREQWNQSIGGGGNARLFKRVEMKSASPDEAE